MFQNKLFFKSYSLFLLTIGLMFTQCNVAKTQQNSPIPSNFTTKKTSNKKAIAALEKGIAAYNANKLDEAVEAFQKSIAADANLIDAHIQLGSVFYDQKNYEKAEIAFENALKLSDTYEPKLLYTLGFVEDLEEKYEEAAVHFAAYLKKNPSTPLKNKAEKALAHAEFAAKAIKNPVPFEPVSLGDKINTKDPEYLPSLTLDEETLVYTKRFARQEDLFMSKKVNNEWQTGIPLSNINTNENEGGQNIAANGKILVYTACNAPKSLGSCDLYFSEFKKGEWTSPQNVGAPINSTAWESQPSLSSDGQTLYFTSNRAGGKGGKDIWKSQRQANGTWSNPENLGEPINTPEDDQSPFIHADGETLYFMSDGLVGMGGHDLFLSRKQANNKWATPQNFGYPINTKNDEGGICVSRDGKTAFFASDRQYDTQKKVNAQRINGFSIYETDIFSFPLALNLQPKPVTYVKAKVKDKETKQPIKANLELIEVENATKLLNTLTDSEGEFLICLPIGKNYALNVNKKNYLFHSENFALQEAKNIEKPYILDIFLSPIVEKPTTTTTVSKPEVVVLKNVFFDTGLATLRKSSFTELNYLLQLLKDNPTMKIQINGHTDNVGSENANLSLSQNRAKAVQDYLIQNGIAQNRLSYKGFGKSQPIDTNDTEEGRQNNRRTEFQITN